MARGTIVTIEPNITRDASGIESVVAVKGLPRRRKRWSLTADLDRVRAWVAVNRKELQEELRAFGTPQAVRGTLEADVARFLPQIAGRSCFKSDRSHLMAWCAVVLPGETTPLGERDRGDVTTEVVNRVIALWQSKPGRGAVRKVRVGSYERGKKVRAHIRSAPATSGVVVSARTIRHRCRMLADLFHTLDGKKAPTPVDEAKIPPIPKTLPASIPADALRAVLVRLRELDLATFVRYAVACTTLQRPAQIGRAQPADFNLEDGIWIVRSAKNEPAHTITLGAEAIAACRAFLAADVCGEFDTGRYGRLIHEAGLPAGVRPYAARHTGAIAAIAAGVTLDAVQGLLGHTSPETTRKFYAPFVIERQREISKQIDGRFAGVFGPTRVKGGA